MNEVLEQLLAEEQRREQLRSTLVSALTYPMFLAGFSVLVVIFVLVVVFPKFGDMFTRIADQLPSTTIALMWLSVPFESEVARFLYYSLTYVCVSLAMTCISVPYLALLPEMATEYDERTSLNTFRSVAAVLECLG